MRKYWGYEIKLAKFEDKDGKQWKVTVKIYQNALKIKGFVKSFLGIIHEWTRRTLNYLLQELGAKEFTKRAGSMEFGEIGFVFVVELAEEGTI